MVQSGAGLRFTHLVNIRHRLLLKDANTEDGYSIPPYFHLSVSRLGLQSAESLGKHYGVIKRILLGLCKCQSGNPAGFSCFKIILE